MSHIAPTRFSRGAIHLLVLALIAAAMVAWSASSARAADTATPVLQSFSVSGKQATPGSTITINYTSTDNSGQPLQAVIFQYTDAVGGSHQIRADGSVPESGTITQVIPASWPTGTSTLDDIYLVDQSSNEAIYERSGQVSKIPSGATGPTSHSFDFSQGDISVAGSSADTATPVLQSFSVSGKQATPGSTITINYTSTDNSGQPLQAVIFQYTDAVGGSHQIRADGSVPESGTITQVIPASWPTGTSTLDDIYLVDQSSNEAIYERSGQVSKIPSGATGPTSHSFDFSQGDISVAVLPSAPTGGQATAEDGSAAVFWTAPSSDGGSPITGYTATASPGGQSCSTTGATSCSVLGLTNGGSYTFTVTATNRVGTGPASSASPAVVPAAATVPAAPSGVTAQAGNGSATVNWTAPSSDGGSPVTGYTATASPGGQACTTTSALSCTVMGLTNGTPYRFTVTASNKAGTSPTSSPSATATPTGTGTSPPPPSGSGYLPQVPTRIVAGQSIAANTAASVKLPDAVPAGSGAIAINVTAVHPSAVGNLRVYADCGTGVSQASLVNYQPGEDTANFVIVPLQCSQGSGPVRTVDFYSANANVTVDVDLAGTYPTTGTTAGGTTQYTTSGFTGTGPTREVDTRTGLGGQSGPIPANTAHRFTLTGIPAGARAVALNVTSVSPTGVGNLRVYPSDQTAVPSTSNVNYIPGVDKAGFVIVDLPADGSSTITIYTAGSADNVAVDVFGYFPTTATTTGLAQPQRVLDTRTGSGVTQGLPSPLAASHPYNITVTGNGVPADAQAVVLSLTAIHTANGTGVGNLRAYPAGGTEPNVSNINYLSPTSDVANLAIVQIGSNGQITLVTSGSPIDAAVDVLGYVPAVSTG